MSSKQPFKQLSIFTVFFLISLYERMENLHLFIRHASLWKNKNFLKCILSIIQNHKKNVRKKLPIKNNIEIVKEVEF